MADIAVETVCHQCNEPIATESRFCKHCGSIQNAEDIELSIKKWESIKQVILFFLFQAVICCLASFISFFKTFAWSVTFDVLLACVSIAFFCDNWACNKLLLQWNNFSFLKTVFYCAIAIISSLTVSLIVSWLNESLFSKEFCYYTFYATHTYGKELMIFFYSCDARAI